MHDVNWIDYGIIGIISISVLFGIVRGFVREAMSLITWVAAITIGTLYCEHVATWFTGISMLGVRLLLAFVLLVLSVLIIGGIISHLFSKLIKSTKFSITDRIVGTLFGLARGTVIVAIVVLLINPTIIAKEHLWKESLFVPKFEPISFWIKDKLPEDLLKIYTHPDEKAKKGVETTEWELPPNLPDSPS